MVPTSLSNIMVWEIWAPSVISINPINIRNDSPRIWSEGCFCIKSETDFMKTIMIPTDTSMDIIIMGNAFGIPFVIPTAVKIESKENTIFKIVIWVIALDKDILIVDFLSSEESFSIFSKISCVLLYSKNKPPKTSIIACPLI